MCYFNDELRQFIMNTTIQATFSLAVLMGATLLSPSLQAAESGDKNNPDLRQVSPQQLAVTALATGSSEWGEKAERTAERIAAIRMLTEKGWQKDEMVTGVLTIIRQENPGVRRALTTKEMANPELFSGLKDFDTLWVFGPDSRRMELRRDPVAPGKSGSTGSGTLEDPYLVETAEQLDDVRNKMGPDVHFRQIADIDLAAYGDARTGWNPISGELGSYDGGGYRIRNLRIARPHADDQGLFGALILREKSGQGRLSRIALENVDIQGRNRVGALGGALGHVKLPGKIENCSASGRISGVTAVGGLGGNVWGYTVESCLVSAEVTGRESVSPLVGRDWWGATLRQCFYNADLAGPLTPQSAAVQALERHAPGMYQETAIFGFLRSDNILVRKRAAEAAALKSPSRDQLVRYFVPAFLDDRFDVRRKVRRLLEEYGEEAQTTVVTELAAGYETTDLPGDMRVRFVRAAGELPGEAGVNLLVHALKDPVADVRLQAVNSLRLMGIDSLGKKQSLFPPTPWWSDRPELQQKAVAALESVTAGDADKNVRSVAQLAISRIGGSEGSPEIIPPAHGPTIELSEDLPEAERKILEKAYAEVESVRQDVLEKFVTHGVEWPYFFAAATYHASACLYVNLEVEAANRLLMEDLELVPRGDEPGSLWGPTWATIYGLYNSRSEHLPGRLTPEAEALFKERMFSYLEWKSEVFDEYIQNIWKLEGTENHHITFGPVLCYLFLGYLAQDPQYASLPLAGGNTVAQWAELWRNYTKQWLSTRALNGFWVELGASYTKYSLPAILMLYVGADDPQVRRLAQMFLDLNYLDEAQMSYDFAGGRGGNRSRADPRAGVGYGFIHQTAFGVEPPFPGHQGLHDAAVSGYRASPEALLLHREYQRPQTPIQIVNRRLGETDKQGVLKQESEILNTCYKTGHFLLGSAVNAPDTELSPLFNQMPWNGLLFASGDGIFPHPVQRENTGRFSRPYYSFQHEDVLIFQMAEDAYATESVPVYVKPGAKRVERNGWIFVEDGEAYCAIRVLKGPYGWNDEGTHLAPEDKFSPVILQGGDVDSCGSFDAFMTAVEENSASWDGTKVEYSGPEQPNIEFFSPKTGKPSLVNGTPVDLLPPLVYNSPFMRRTAGSPIVTVTVGPYVTEYDFSTAEIRRTVHPDSAQ